MTKTSSAADSTFYQNNRAALDLAGAAGVSGLLQPVSTTLAAATSQKAAGSAYSNLFPNIVREGALRFAQQNFRIYGRRFGSSILPGTLLENIYNNNGWSNLGLTATSALVESIIASTVTKEAKERLNVNLGPRYPFPFDLSNITKQQFFDNKDKNPVTAGYGEKEWNDLKSRQNNFRANLPYQFGLLLTRNSFFSAAVFGVGPLAASISDSVGKGEDGRDIVDRNYLKFAIRTGLAASTTIFDRLLTISSTGELTAAQIIESTFNTIAKGNIRALMAGGLARTALCVFNSTAFDVGLKQGPAIADFVQKMINMSMPDNERVEAKEGNIKIDPNENFDFKALRDAIKEIDVNKVNEDLQKQKVSGITLTQSEIEKAVTDSAKSVTQIGFEVDLHESAKQKPSTSISKPEESNSIEAKILQEANKTEAEKKGGRG